MRPPRAGPQVDGGIDHPDDGVGRIDLSGGLRDQQLVADRGDRDPRPGKLRDVADPGARRVHHHGRGVTGAWVSTRVTRPAVTGMPMTGSFSGCHGSVPLAGRQAGRNLGERLLDKDVLRAPQRVVVVGGVVISRAAPGQPGVAQPRARRHPSVIRVGWPQSRSTQPCAGRSGRSGSPGRASIGRCAPVRAKVTLAWYAATASRVRSSLGLDRLNRPPPGRSLPTRRYGVDHRQQKGPGTHPQRSADLCHRPARRAHNTTSASTGPLCRSGGRAGTGPDRWGQQGDRGRA